MAVYVDGTDDYVRIYKASANAFNCPANTSWMIDFWWYCTSTTYDRYMLVCGKYDENPNIHVYWSSSGGAGTFEYHYVDEYGNDNVVATGFGVTGTWRYSALVRIKPSATWLIRHYYPTSSYEEATSVSAGAVQKPNVIIGARESTGGSYWRGYISRLRIQYGVTIADIERTIRPARTQRQRNIPLDTKSGLWVPFDNTTPSEYSLGATVQMTNAVYSADPAGKFLHNHSNG